MGVGSIWTPGGEHPVQERGVESLTRDEIITLSKMQEICFNRELTIFCRKCEKLMAGQNNGNSKVLTLQCGCRELRYDGR